MLREPHLLLFPLLALLSQDAPLDMGGLMGPVTHWWFGFESPLVTGPGSLVADRRRFWFLMAERKLPSRFRSVDMVAMVS